MKETTTTDETMSMGARDVLGEVLDKGARDMLTRAIEYEVAAYITEHQDCHNEKGYRQVVRNVYLPPRMIQTQVVEVAVTQPRVNDKRIDADIQRMRFTSNILPPYLRRTKSKEGFRPPKLE